VAALVLTRNFRVKTFLCCRLELRAVAARPHRHQSTDNVLVTTNHHDAPCGASQIVLYRPAHRWSFFPTYRPDPQSRQVYSASMSESSDRKASVEDHKLEVGHLQQEGDNREGAIEAENAEHSMTVLQAVRAYPMASFWAFVMSSTIIMESYDVFLMGNFLALEAFKNRFGVVDSAGDHVIVTKWQSALQMSGQLGALIGVFLAGPLTSRIGYRWATIIGLMVLNATIFVSFFANSLPVFFAGQLLEGIPWGIFIANAPAYCSEIVPLRLRAPATQMLQMFWAIGSIIVGAVTFVYNTKDDRNAYRYGVCSSVTVSLLSADARLGSQSHSNGYSPPLSPFSCFVLPNRLGG
jgi:hypothetical protein